MKRSLHFVCLFFLFAALPLAAQRAVSGKVTDYRTDQPLPGVSVLVEGRAAITRTDATGMFRLEVPAGGEALQFSLAGYATARVEMTAVNVYDITLKRLDQPDVAAPDQDYPALLPPVDTIPVALLANAYGQVELSQLLTFSAPYFQSSRQTLAEASDHVDPVQLRGMATDQVLVLVNGKRRHHSALVHTGPTPQRGMAQGTDWNAIPLAAIERIEVQRDVAGTQYGSDAVAGVVNIILKNKPGLDASVSYGQRFSTFDKNLTSAFLGQTSQPDVTVNDGQTLHAGLHYGFALGSGGRLNLTGEYLRRGATNRAGTFTGKLFPPASTGGNDDSLQLAQRGLTREDFDRRLGEAEMQGFGLLYDLDLALTPAWNLYSFGSFYQKNSEAGGSSYFSPYDLWNVFTLSPLLVEYPNGFLPLVSASNLDLAATLGVHGALGDWTLDLSNTFGQNRLEFSVENSVNFTQASGSFGGPAPTLQTMFDNGGLASWQNTANLDVTRRFAAVLNGLRLAAGAEFRLESFELLPGETLSWNNLDSFGYVGLQPGAFGFLGFREDDAGARTRNNLGVYLRLDQSFSPAFQVSLTGRFDRYSDLGNLFTGKLALGYRPSPVFGLHAAVGTGFRAPTLSQQFYQRSGYYAFDGPTGEIGIFAQDSEAAQIFEPDEVEAETNLGLSAGLTLRPVAGLELTLDVWQVSVRNRMILTNGLDAGQSGQLDSLFTQFGVLSVAFFDQAIDTRSQGLEAGLRWRKSLDDRQQLDLGLKAAFYRNEVDKDDDDLPVVDVPDLVVQAGQTARYFNREDLNRLEGALPRAKVVASAGYQYRPFGASLRATWFGPVQYRDPLGAREDNLFGNNSGELLDQDLAGKTVLDLSLHYDFTAGIRLTLGAHNLLDTYPDRHTHSFNADEGRVVYSTQAQQLGFAGRYLFARVSTTL